MTGSTIVRDRFSDTKNNVQRTSKGTIWDQRKDTVLEDGKRRYGQLYQEGSNVWTGLFASLYFTFYQVFYSFIHDFEYVVIDKSE